EADDQAIQTILLGLPEDIYATVDSCETDQEIWLRVQQMMKGSDNEIQEKKAKLFNEWERAPVVIITFLKRITVLLQKPDISLLHVFGALCYPKNDREDIGKLGAKGDIDE
nr:integrase, catalytic region, zinc finger, CCHC-type, peptidase aspartic, catalytic [Tanacetum cinerariifolium]